MNNPRRPEHPYFPEPGSTQPLRPSNPPPTDPAYADQAPYGPAYGGQAPQWESAETMRLSPQYWQQDQQQPGAAPQEGLIPLPPEGPKSQRWLWVAAAAAVLLVVALGIALVLANGAVKRQTTVPPLPAMPEPSSTTSATTTRTKPSLSAAPIPTTTSSSETTDPAAMQTVLYNVTGDGRAISVTYTDTGDVTQTEFNVALPWSKQVNLSKSATHPASVTIVNIGHDVTCSVAVAGVQVRQRTGMGITVCDSAG